MALVNRAFYALGVMSLKGKQITESSNPIEVSLTSGLCLIQPI